MTLTCMLTYLQAEPAAPLLRALICGPPNLLVAQMFVDMWIA